jgi:esterase/lipase superfamily enzyme
MFRERDSVVALFIIAFLVIPMAAVPAEKSTSQSDEALHIIGWRSPSKIVLRGNVVGLDRLREVANGIELQSDSKMPTEGEPTSLVRGVVSTLSELQSGWVDIGDRKLSIVGVAESVSIERLKQDILQYTAKNIKIVTLRIGSLDRPPFQWAAYRYKDEFGSDTIDLNGLAIDENARAKLISLARGASGDVIVVDKMKVQSSPSAQLTDAAAAGLAQLGQLDDGFVWVDANEVNLFGSSFDYSVSDRKLGCAILNKVITKGITCGIVDIVQRQGHYRYHHSRRGGHANNDTIAKNAFSKTKPFVALDPNKIKASSPIDEYSDPRVVDILFATLRKLEQADTPAAPTFSGERGQALSYGRARVRIPEDHKIGRLELPGGFSIFGIQLTHEETDPKKHFILRSRQPLSLEQWDSLIEGIGPSEAVVFVHGFNMSFDDSAVRFAQIVWDLQYKGLPVLFSWPSRGAVIDYAYDRDSALGARDAFLDLLSNLRDTHKISTVHVIAHSMGNFLVLDALTRLAKSPSPAMGQLIMAAPDVDRDQFVQEIPKIRQFFRGLTLYASSADKALTVSMRVAGGIPRAGDVPAEGPIVLPGLETLDVTALGQEMFGLNHTTFAQARPLIDDISLILSESRHAPRLAQERPMPENASAPKYWRFAP